MTAYSSCGHGQQLSVNLYLFKAYICAVLCTDGLGSAKKDPSASFVYLVQQC